MKYTVVWKPEAERRLTEIWLQAHDRAAITAACHSIDTLLKNDPESRGESRSQNRRILFESPLGVSFRISRADRMVTVATVWRFKTH